MRLEFDPHQDPPKIVAAEALQSIAHDVHRIADELEERDRDA